MIMYFIYVVFVHSLDKSGWYGYNYSKRVFSVGIQTSPHFPWEFHQPLLHDPTGRKPNERWRSQNHKQKGEQWYKWAASWQRWCGRLVDPSGHTMDAEMRAPSAKNTSVKYSISENTDLFISCLEAQSRLEYLCMLTLLPKMTTFLISVSFVH